MPCVENSIELRAPPWRVWRALTALDGYAKWHPFIESRGEPTPGADVDYVFRNSRFWRPFTAAVTVLRNEESTAFAWRLGVGRFLSFDETFEIEPSEHGSTLRHRMVGRGLGRLLWLRFVSKGLRNYIVTTDAALDRHLRGIAPPAAKPSPGNRMKRRVAQSRARHAPVSRMHKGDR